ncbi:MAG TPA: hypothetical protein PKA27_12125 [Fimbriimonadaceae bacterium]|nr:hypothetical protein [Fimbriimonadaceae bacterium]
MKSFQVWALLSALFAGITAILAKKGVGAVPTHLAVAVYTEPVTSVVVRSSCI